jgi:predicted dehydrogenase
MIRPMPLSRRRFSLALSAGLPAFRAARVWGANDRVGVGFIGYGLIGGQHLYDFKQQPDTDLHAVSDVYQPRIDAGLAVCGSRAKGYRDFRRLLDDKSVDAVVISTPDHWHALMTILACAAGKDVFVEKPLTLFQREGQWIVKAVRKYKRIVQTGVQQRSGPHYQSAKRLIAEGLLGKVHSVRMASFRNIMPGFGSPADGAAPSDFDYDLWLGPAPKRPFNPQRGLYHFRWFWDYSGGQMTNLGAHSIDILQWYMNVPGPLAVSSSGGRLALPDLGETPDTQDALFEYGPFTAVWSHREAAAGRRGGGLEFAGTRGSLTIGRSGFEVTPELKVDPADSVPVFQGHPPGGVKGSNAKPVPYFEPRRESGTELDQFTRHTRNFLDCVKSRREPIAPAEDSHRVATACHLANISLRTGRKIRWDNQREEILNDPAAAALLERPYRAPWDRELKAALA